MAQAVLDNCLEKHVANSSRAELLVGLATGLGACMDGGLGFSRGMLFDQHLHYHVCIGGDAVSTVLLRQFKRLHVLV
jgi:hypothetical protein